MPTISVFFGIVIQMYVREHPPPHFHVSYQGYKAVILIEDGAVVRGKLPVGALRIVREWTHRHRDELLKNWERSSLHEPLWPITGADKE